MKPDTVVVLEGVNGVRFTIAGPNAGDKGVFLGTGLREFFDPPVKVVSEEPGNYPGSRYLNHRILRRDLVFAVEILDDPSKNLSWLSRDSEWRKAWSFEADCKLFVTTPESGTRYLKVRLLESPQVDTTTDPRMHTINRVSMVCVAYDPFWWGEDEIHTAVTQTDTSFDPNALQLPWPWPQNELPKETLFIDVPKVNPTDQIIWPKWSVPGSTEAPAEPYIPWLPWLGAPKSRAAIWTLPDYSWQDDDQKNRRLRLPGLIGGLRTNEIQQLVIDGRPTGGNFKLKFGSETTGNIPHNASTTQIQNALVALAQIAAGDVEVTRNPAVNEQQTVELTGGATGGSFRLAFEDNWTDWIPFNAIALNVYAALAALPQVSMVGVTVEQDSKDCVQEIRIVGEPTKGTFKLKFDGETTGEIPYNASNLTVAFELSKLASIGSFDINVTGAGLFGGGPWWKVAFQGNLAGVNVNRLTADASGLSGGAGIAVNTKILTPGGRKYTITFGGSLSGYNAEMLNFDASRLTGGKNPSVDIRTTTEGSHPFQITFLGNLSGKDVPQLEPTQVALTGGRKPRVTTAVRLEGATAPAENAFVDTDPRVEQVVSESGSEVWARMNGVRFKHFVPPYTAARKFEITVSGCKPGQMVALRLPRPFSRPWGLEG